MTHRLTRSLIFACASAIAMPVAADVASPHDRAPAHRPDAPTAATPVRGDAPTIFQEFIFDYGALETAAFVTMTASDLDGDGRIEANAGFFEGPVINEIITLTISFWRSGVEIFETTCVDGGVNAYPYLYLDWGIGDSGPTAWDLGADPGMFTFGGSAVTPNDGAWFLRTSPLEGGVFGDPLQYVVAEPTILSSERSYAMDAFVVGEVTEEVEPFVFDCVPCTDQASPSDATTDADAWFRDEAFTLFCSGAGACGNEGIVSASVTHDSSAVAPDEIMFDFAVGASRSGDPVNAATATSELRVTFARSGPGFVRINSVGAFDGMSSVRFEIAGPFAASLDTGGDVQLLLPAGSHELTVRATAVGETETPSTATLSGVIAFRQARVRNLTQGVAFVAIQDAIDGAVAGDVIEILPGVYRELLNLSGKAITLRSTIPSSPATVDQTIISGDLDGDGTGDETVIRCTSGEGPSTVLDGLTITKGNSITVLGGGLRISAADPTIRRCNFKDNTASRGGAIAASFSEALIDSCRFVGNRSTGGGGGAVWNEGSGTFSTDAATIVNCLITGNVSESSGGAITSIGANPAIINCTLTENTNVGSAAIANFFNGPLTITNTIVWNNQPAGPPISSGAVAPLVTYCIVEGGFAGPGNLDQDPLFVDASAGDYRIDAGSPAIDAGDNTAFPVASGVDVFGRIRFLDDPATPDAGVGPAPVIDIGAHEFQPLGTVIPVCAADLDGSGVIDFGDLNRVLDAWNSEDSTADVNLDGQVDFLDLNRILDAWGVACM